MERSITSPLGPLTILAGPNGITAVEWRSGAQDDTVVLRRAEAQLHAYFDGQQQEFTLPLRLTASPFQRQVCAAIAAIPYGQTRSYGDLARDLGAPPQAIGQACGANPIPILIPCHRVLGQNALGGFSGKGGLDDKIWLLRHEGALLL